MRQRGFQWSSTAQALIQEVVGQDILNTAALAHPHWGGESTVAKLQP